MNLKLHHIGVACSDLEIESDKLQVLGYVQEGNDFVDPIQGVAGRFLVGGGVRLELLVSLSAGGALTPWLATGVKLYHLAYEASDLGYEISRLKKHGAKVLVHPVSAVAFEERKIAFLMLPNMLLIELIENTLNAKAC